MRAPAFIILLMALIGVAVLVAVFMVFRVVNTRTRKMARRVSRSDAVLSEECMVRFGFRECPGVAQITRDTLYVDTAFFDIHLALPLATLKVSKVVAGAGRYTGTLGWLGKSRFHVSAPCLGRPLVIGIKSGEEWRRALEHNAGR